MQKHMYEQEKMCNQSQRLQIMDLSGTGFPQFRKGSELSSPRIKKVINMSPTEVIDKGFTHWQGTLGGVKQRFRLA